LEAILSTIFSYTLNLRAYPDIGYRLYDIILLTYFYNIIRAKKFKNPKNKWSTDTQAKLFTMKYHRFSRRSKKSLYSLHN
jgi:hypothetical protein